MMLCHLEQRSLLRLSGPDVRSFLQGLLTADVETLSAESPHHSALLSPQGKTLFQLFLFADGDNILLDVAADQAEALAKRLAMFRLRRQVTIEPVPDLWVMAGWNGDFGHPADPRLPQAGQRFVAEAGSMTPTASIEEWHRHRLPLGLPEADEISDDLLWLEANGRELNGVSFTKGCYTGQENTARMHYRDKLRKRLLPVRISGDMPDEANMQVLAGERVAGELRGRLHGDMRMLLLKMDYLDQPLRAGDAIIEVIRPVWLPAD